MICNGTRTHPLAKAESELAKAKAGCQMCEAYTSGASGRAAPYQEKAIEYAGNVIESVRGYEISPPGFDGLANAYALVYPMLGFMVKGLGKARTAEGLREFFGEFVLNYPQKDEIEGLEGASILEQVKMVSEHDAIGYTTQFWQIKGLGFLGEKAEAMNRGNLIKALRGTSERITEGNLEAKATIESMKNFMGDCSEKMGCGDGCEETRKYLEEGAEKVAKMQENRVLIERPGKEFVSWFLDVPASFLENMTDDQFEEERDKLIAQATPKVMELAVKAYEAWDS